MTETPTDLYFHLNERAHDTQHLSMLEEGAYCRLMDHHYGDGSDVPMGSNLPVDFAFCCQVAGANSAAERQAVQRVLDEFFEEAGYTW